MAGGWDGENSFKTGSFAPAVNNFTIEQWAIREAADAVFFPLSSTKDTYTNYWLGSKGSKDYYCTLLQMYYDSNGYFFRLDNRWEYLFAIKTCS